MKVPLAPPPSAMLPMTIRELTRAILGEVDDSSYLHWDDVFHRTPPTGLTTTEWWAILKLGRMVSRRRVPLPQLPGGALFGFNLPDPVQQMLLRIDQQAAGRLTTSDPILTVGLRDKYVMSSLTEEAITSSQLEGASTSRRVAKDMLRTGRAPKTRSEQMILNNFRAMEYVREHVAEPLTPELVVEIQRIVTEDTLDDPQDAGRLQQPGDERVRVWGDHDQVLHTPPPAEELPERMHVMCDFANGGGETFVHPVVRAVLLHFWLAYDHPFADGNGRTARILFYWSMLSQGYWLTEFLSISRILRKAPSQYARSFLLTETDENDLTYFLLYHLKVILRSIEELTAYVERKSSEVRSAERLVKTAGRLNHRQLDLVSHALRNPDGWYTVQSHRRSHNVVYETARSDLLDLVDLGLLVQGKVGKAFRFAPANDIEDRLREV